MKHKYQILYGCAAAVLLSMVSTNSLALDVKISQDIEAITVHHGAEFLTIQREQDQSNVLSGGFTKTSRKCPPFCIQPLTVAPGVETVAELELLTFIEKKLELDKGLLIDARTPSWFQKGTIPGSINIPFTQFDPEKSIEKLAKVLVQLNVKKKGDGGGSFLDSLKGLFGGGDSSANSDWDFSKAKEVLLYCNGIWCGQSPHAIKNLLALGYPAEKIHYYRGGMQAWQSLGLTVYKPE